MPQANVRFFEHPVERTEEQIEELRLAGLLRGEPSVLDTLRPRGAPGYANLGAADARAAASAAGTPDLPVQPAPGSDKPAKSKE